MFNIKNSDIHFFVLSDLLGILYNQTFVWYRIFKNNFVKENTLSVGRPFFVRLRTAEKVMVAAEILL